VPISQLIVKGTCNQDYTIDHTGRQKVAAGSSAGNSAAPSAEGGTANAASSSGTSK